ncbi:type VI secretion IcmF C-terminal domain-containing protein, partial [Psychrobacter sp. AOP5-CZ1-12]
SPFIIRRGDQISSKIWNGAGLGLNPQFVADFGRYFTNYTGNSSAGPAGGTNANGAANQTTFQIMPLPVSGLTEYTIVVDGQQLRYRMGTQAWTTFVWPNPSSQPGASIRAKDYDGRDFTVFEEAGSFGVERMINSARRTELGDDIFEMAWSGDGITIPVRFRLISGSGGGTTPQGRASNPFTGMKLPDEVIALGVTRSAMPVSDSNPANGNEANSGTSTGRPVNSPTAPRSEDNGTTEPTPAPNALNLTPTTDDSDQTDTPTTTTDSNTTTTDTQEPTP